MKKIRHAFSVRAYWLFSLLLAPVALGAQERRDSIAERELQMDQLTVTARRAPVKITSATSVQVLSKDDLKSLGLRDMADAVRRFAGTNVRDYGGIGGLKTVSVRNLGAAHTAVSYDGVAVSNTQAGQIDIGRFSLDNVSSLSLAIGQDENLLQPARLYAAAGVLNIETERPQFEEGRRSQSQVLVRGGSFGYVTPAFRHWQKLGEATSIGADASFVRADGAYPFELKNGTLVTEEKRRNSDVETWQAEANLFHSLQGGGELDAKVHYFHSERGLPGAVILYNPLSDERLWDENFFAQARLRLPLSEKWSLSAQAKYNYSWNRYEDLGVEYVGGKQTDTNRQNEYYLSATVLFRPAEHWQLSLAQDGAINTLHTNGVNSPEPVRYTSLTALTARYTQGGLKASATVVGTYITEEVESGNKPADRHRLSPSVSVSYRPWEVQDFYLRAMYKNTFRVPTFSDLYYLRVGNTNLKPEKATEYTVGVAYTFRPSRVADYLTITVDGYMNQVDDKIIAFPSTYVWKMQNYGNVSIKGIDVTAATSLLLGKQVRMNLSGTYSWQQALDKTNPEAKNYKNQIPYTPEHNGNVSATVETPWVNLGYALTLMGKRYYLAQNLPVNQIDGYAEHTLTLWKEFKLGRGNLRLQAEAINLTDAQYEIIKYYPMPGRTWRLCATYRF